MTKILVGTMGSWESGERPTLDDAGVTVTFRDPRNIDLVTDLKKIGRFNFLSDLILRDVVEPKFAQHREGAFAGLRHVALGRFIHPLRLLAAKADLQRGVTIRVSFLLLHDHTRPGLYHRDGNHIPLGVVELHHA